MTLPLSSSSHQHHADTTALALVWQIALVDTSAHRRCAPVVEVVVQLTVSCAELELLKEERVVHQGEGVEDIELGLVESQYTPEPLRLRVLHSWPR